MQHQQQVNQKGLVKKNGVHVWLAATKEQEMATDNTSTTSSCSNSTREDDLAELLPHLNEVASTSKSSSQSFPAFLSFATAEERFMVLLKESQVHDMHDMFPHDRAQFMLSILFAPLLEQYNHGSDVFTLPYTIGTTKIYFRAGALELLDGLRRDYLSIRAVKIQQKWRKRTANRIGRNSFARLKRCIILLQAHARTRSARRSFGRLTKSTRLIQYWYQGRLLKRRYDRIKRGFTALQQRYRLVVVSKRNTDRVMSTNMIHPSMNQATVATSRSCPIQSSSGFTRLQAQYRGVAERKRQAAKCHIAATILTSLTRMCIQRVRYVCLVRATTRVQRTFRAKFQSKSRQHNANDKNDIGDRDLPVADAASESLSTGLVEATSTQHPIVCENRTIDPWYPNANSNGPATESSSGGGDGLEAKSLHYHVSSNNAATKEDVAEEPTIMNDNIIIRKEAESADHDTDSNMESLLQSQIKRLQEELDCRNQQIAELHQTVAQVTEEAEMHTQEIEGDYEDRLCAYEQEVVQLKQELDENRASHEQKIGQLMQEYKSHLESASFLIEKEQEARKAETDNIMQQIHTMQSEKNETILQLEAQLAQARSNSMKMTPPALTVASPGTDESDWSFSSAERDPSYLGRDAQHELNGGEGCNISYLDEVEKLRRDLLTITATHNLVDLVQKASSRPWQKDVHIERLYKSVESRVNRLGDLAVQRYMWCEEPTVKHMRNDHKAIRSPMPVDVVERMAPSPTSSLDDSSHETKP